MMLMLFVGFGFTSWSSKNVKNDVLYTIPINTQTIEGDIVKNDIYEDYDLTVVNIMATWCGPCVKEIPELQEIYEEDNGIGVIGVVYDTYNSKTGASDRKAIYAAENIKDKTGAKYPFIIPNDDIIDSTLKGRGAILPMTFFVDNKGNILEGPLAGAKSKEEWLSIINKVKNKNR